MRTSLSTVLAGSIILTGVGWVAASPALAAPVPTLDMYFTPSGISAGQSAALVFDITNVTGLPEHEDWGLTAVLPTGLVPEISFGSSTTCAAAHIVTNSTTGRIVVDSGRINAGTASCQVVVTVGSDGTALGLLGVTAAATEVTGLGVPPDDARIFVAGLARDAATTHVGQPVDIDVRDNDIAMPPETWGQPLLTTAPTNGDASVNANGTVRYTPHPGFSGDDTLRYHACSSANTTCDFSSATITVQNVFVGSGSVTTPQNIVVEIPLDDILHTNGRPLDPTTVTEDTAPAHGMLAIDPVTGAVDYAPAPGYSGADTFRIQVCDTSVPTQCAPGRVDVVVGTNQVTAIDDVAATDAAVPVITRVLDNDGSASGQPWAPLEVTDPPANGSTTVHPDGTITYLPDAGHSGLDHYTYRACDTSTPVPVCDTARVDVTVRNVFVPGPGLTTVEDTAVEAALADLVTTTGRPLNPQRASLVTGPGHGQVSVDPTTGAVRYTPAAGHVGSDEFVLNVCDTAYPVICRDLPVPVTVTALGRPVLTTSAAESVALPVDARGRTGSVKLTDQVTITGLRPGAGSTGTATLYGPTSQRSAAACSPSNLVATVSFAAHDGTLTTPPVTVSRPGHYTWVVTTAADALNESAGHGCGLATETTLVHRPDYGPIRVETGFDGVAEPGERAGRRTRPARVSITEIGLSARLDPVGLRRGAMVIPDAVARGGWLTRSAVPGEKVGTTVLAGHVSDRHDRPGAFGRLARARRGQLVKVRGADGSLHRYRIVRIRRPARGQPIDAALTTTSGAHRLVLVTCVDAVHRADGSFHYRRNLIVVARPVR
ncbi:Ig-like domain-containing protein [Nocardioides nitrophenolicus]|uniref:Ig-like domain-containing protein n=1 Tax=Nocardioides nitrophenolicus TaxID=60489 RepID=UPI00195CB45A|nr:Ig-like domain-containing protein [Nocardioides nitrophenolicus]MBM7517252.1 hypothetical protein [Nocardioides nitrophenolicus]